MPDETTTAVTAAVTAAATAAEPRSAAAGANPAPVAAPGGTDAEPAPRLSPTVLRERYEQAISFEDFIASARVRHDLWRDMAARVRVPEELTARARQIPAPRRLLVLLEDWCGDAVNTIPVLAALVRDVPQLDLRVLARDEHLDLMDAHLSPAGARAIPVVIVLDESFAECGWWGSRPAELQAWVMAPEARRMEPGERYREVRRWYARDRGRSALREILELLDHCSPDQAAPDPREADAPTPAVA